MTKDFYGIVYSITNSVNGKMYIGQTIQPLKNRMHQHLYKARKGKMLPLYSSIRKYGWDNFKCEIIGYAKSKEELDDMETIVKEDYLNNTTSDEEVNRLKERLKDIERQIVKIVENK